MSAAIDWQQQRERAHVPHDSALSVGAGIQIMGGDAERVKELEEEIRELNQKLVSASMSVATRSIVLRLLVAFQIALADNRPSATLCRLRERDPRTAGASATGEAPECEPG